MRRANVLLDTHAPDMIEDEAPTLFQVLKQRRRRETREIRKVYLQDSDGMTYTRPQDISSTFIQHLARKFGPLTVDGQAIIDC